MNFKRKQTLLFYLVPFLALLISEVNYLINSFTQLDLGKFIIFIFVNILFILSLSETIGKILLENVLNFFEDKEKSPVLIALYSQTNFSVIKPLIIIFIFIGLFIFLSVNLSEMGILKLLVMLIPSVAVFLNSKSLINNRVRLINSKYIIFKNQFENIISFYINSEDNISFLCSDGTMIDTNFKQTSVDYEAFKNECLTNGLKTKN